jgi:hypothetical protein
MAWDEFSGAPAPGDVVLPFLNPAARAAVVGQRGNGSQENRNPSADRDTVALAVRVKF